MGGAPGRVFALTALSVLSCGPGPAPAMPPVEASAGGASEAAPAGKSAPRSVSITSTGILLDGRKLMAAPALEPKTGTTCALDLDQLTGALDARTSRHPLPLSVAPGVPFELLCSALRAVWSAGIIRVRLHAVGRGVAEEVGPPPLPPAQPNKRLLLTVVVGDSGFFVGGAGGLMPAQGGTHPTVRCLPPLRAGRCDLTGERDPYDYEALSRLLRRIKHTFGVERLAVVSADPAVPAAAVIKALNVVRGKPGDADSCALSGGCLFDRVALDAFAGARARVAGGRFLKQLKGSTRMVP